MNQTAILRPIGKGQITIPLAWRKALGIDRVAISARLEEGRIVLEPLPRERVKYDERTVAGNLAQLLEGDEGKLLTVQLSHDPADRSVLYKTEQGHGVYFPEGISASELLQTLEGHIAE